MNAYVGVHISKSSVYPTRNVGCFIIVQSKDNSLNISPYKNKTYLSAIQNYQAKKRELINNALNSQKKSLPKRKGVVAPSGGKIIHFKNKKLKAPKNKKQAKTSKKSSNKIDLMKAKKNKTIKLHKKSKGNKLKSKKKGKKPLFDSKRFEVRGLSRYIIF